MSERKKKIINVGKIGEKHGFPTQDVVLPNGMKVNAQKWKKEHIQKAISELKYCFSEPENTYLLTEVPEPWITLALYEALQPLNVLYLFPKEDMGDEFELCELNRGVQSSNYDVVFEVVEEDDEIFINLNSDNPDIEPTWGPHTFDPANFCKVAIPEIPGGKHVYVHGKGMFLVMVCIAKNFVKGSKSVSLAAHDADYTCSVSFTDEREIGDVRRRTLPNNL